MDLREMAALRRTPELASRHPWEQARAEILLGWLQPRTTGCGTLLDVGCGDGYVAGRVSQKFPGFDCYGVDEALSEEVPAPPGVALLRSLDEVPAHRFPAAVVLLMDVLEHVPEPVLLMQQLVQRGVVGPATLVVVTVPAFQALFGRHDQVINHYRRYSQRLLSEHLTAAGLRSQRQGYLFFCLLLVRGLEVLLQKLGVPGGSQGLAEWRGGPTLSGFLRRLLVWDHRLAEALRKRGLNLPGLSCYALCSRA